MTLFTPDFLLACYVALGPILVVPVHTQQLRPPAGAIIVPVPNDLMPSQDAILVQVKEWRKDADTAPRPLPP